MKCFLAPLQEGGKERWLLYFAFRPVGPLSSLFHIIFISGWTWNAIKNVINSD